MSASRENRDKAVSSRVKAETKEVVEHIAESEGKSKSKVIQELLVEGIDNRERREQRTRVEVYLQRCQEVCTAFLIFTLALAAFTTLGEIIGVVTQTTEAVAYTIAVVLIPTAGVVVMTALLLIQTGAARAIGLRVEKLSNIFPQVS